MTSGQQYYSFYKKSPTRSSETDFLSLGTNWKVAPQVKLGETVWSDATVKIFTNEIEFKNYKESKRNKG